MYKNAMFKADKNLRCYGIVFLTAVLFGIIYTYKQNGNPSLTSASNVLTGLSSMADDNPEKLAKDGDDDAATQDAKATPFTDHLAIPTTLKKTTYKELFESVYNPRGYQMCSDSSTSLWKELYKKPNCSQSFETFLHYSNQPQTVVKEIPTEQYDDFTLNRFMHVFSYFFQPPVYTTSHDFNTASTWSKETIDSYISMAKNRQQFTYNADTLFLYAAMEKYKDVVSGSRALVIGSLSPWVEGIALAWGAKHVTTAEYANTKCTDPRCTILHPVEVAKNWPNYVNAYDIALSFSSLEHSGLGRFGDALCANCDFVEMEKTACLVKPGGLFFLAIPSGKDTIAFNAHRVYGLVRLPLMTANWKLIDIFDWVEKPIETGRSEIVQTIFQNNLKYGEHGQPVLVLKNTKEVCT